jgi:hypothetical protein
MAASASRVRGWIFSRPSDTMQTTIFCHPSSPQVRLRLRLQKWLMFFMTACMVRVKPYSSSLYMVMQMNSSVSRAVLPMHWRSL